MEEKTKVSSREIRRKYQELLSDDRWFAFASEVKDRKGKACEICAKAESEVKGRLQVHHLGYESNAMPWEYDDNKVLVLCDDCHGNIHLFADEVWNEALKSKNQWTIYECVKAVKEVVRRNGGAE